MSGDNLLFYIMFFAVALVLFSFFLCPYELGVAICLGAVFGFG